MPLNTVGQDTATTLTELESRVDIEELVGRYARACDSRNLEAFLDLWVDDGAYDTGAPGGPARGVEGLRAAFAAMAAARAATFHLATNLVVDITDMTVASATSDALAYGLDLRGQHLLTAARYTDTLRRCPDGKWRFVKRRVEILSRRPLNVLTDEN